MAVVGQRITLDVAAINALLVEFQFRVERYVIVKNRKHYIKEKRMIRIKFIVYSVFLLLMAAMGGNVAADRAPNVLYILADDLGYGELGCYDGPDAKTRHPNKNQ